MCDVCKSMYLYIIHILKYTPKIEKLQVWEKCKSKWRHSSVFLNRYPMHAWGGTSMLEAATLTILWLLTSKERQTDGWPGTGEQQGLWGSRPALKTGLPFATLANLFISLSIRVLCYQRRAIPTNDTICNTQCLEHSIIITQSWRNSSQIT